MGTVLLYFTKGDTRMFDMPVITKNKDHSQFCFLPLWALNVS